ncbi:MAG TPA: hypothetical protein VKA84_05970, partial [Gemmatimonadaceae bacterium]|nr:hypothetical protein [Gemmatimonadaceae bacterium]
RDALRGYAPPASDSRAAASPAALLDSLAGGGDPYATSPRALFMDTSGELGSAAALLRRAAAGLGADTARLIATLDAHPRTQRFRRLAGGAPAGQADRAEDDAPGTVARRVAALSEAAHANALAAALALSRRDYRTAGRRLAENAAAAEQLVRAPSEFANHAGVGIVRTLALLPLAEVEEARGDLARARALREAADALDDFAGSVPWRDGAAGMAADPARLGAFAGLVGDSLLAPGVRRRALDALWDGGCLNPRELVAGPSPARERWLRAAADSARWSAAARAQALAALRTRQAADTAARDVGRYGRVLPAAIRARWARERDCLDRLPA